MCGILLQLAAKSAELPKTWQLCPQMLSRGPDDSQCFTVDKLRLIHTRLAISHNSQQQPAVSNDGNIIIAFNGELYNTSFQDNRYSECRFIMDLYNKFGADYASYLDGEYSIVVIDMLRGIVHLSRDYFGTKPLFGLRTDDVLQISTIADQLGDRSLGSVPTAVPRNSTLTYRIDTIDLVAQREVYRPHHIVSPGYLSWGNLIRAELVKRWPLGADTFIPLSSGHDSGLIAALADQLGYTPTFYSCPRGENLLILGKRLDYLKSRGHRIVVLDLPDHLEENIRQKISLEADHVPFVGEGFRLIDPIRDDPSPMGLATIFKHAKLTGHRVAISGQGGDEIYSGGYGGFGPSINSSFRLDEDASKLPYDLFPWCHLLDGRMQQYLLKEEVVASMFSIEARYPLLSLSTLMSYLHDYKHIYSQYYKGPIEQELLALGFPVDLTRLKRGFNPYSMDRSEMFLQCYSDVVVSAEEVWM